MSLTEDYFQMQVVFLPGQQIITDQGTYVAPGDGVRYVGIAGFFLYGGEPVDLDTILDSIPGEKSSYYAIEEDRVRKTQIFRTDGVLDPEYSSTILLMHQPNKRQSRMLSVGVIGPTVERTRAVYLEAVNGFAAQAHDPMIDFGVIYNLNPQLIVTLAADQLSRDLGSYQDPRVN